MAELTLLHLLIGSVPGGVLRYIVDLSVACRERGVEVVLAGQRGDWHSLVEQGGLEWCEIPIRSGLAGLLRCPGILASHFDGRRPGVIHVHHRKAALVGRRLQRRLGERVPLLYTLHLTDMPMGFPWRWLTDFGDHCHAPSADAKRWLIDVGRVPEMRITVIPHGLRPERWPVVTESDRAAARQRFACPPGSLVGAFVGRLEDPKNEAWVIDLAAECRKLGIATKWLIAGDGPNRPMLQRHIADLSLAGDVTLLGECDPLPVYHAADLLVLPSSREGFGYSCAEAMCCGVPVLRTRTAGTQEMIIERQTGRSCDIDKAAFIRSALEMLQAPDTLRKMGSAAAAHIRQNLSFDRQVDATLDLYRNLCSARVKTM